MNEPAHAIAARSVLVRWIYFATGCVLVVLGIAGIVLPLMPGTLFLILAAACFARSSPRLERWLIDHPRYGPGVRAWRAHGAVPRRAKIVATSAMGLSLAVMALAGARLWAIGLAGGTLALVALWLITRPEGPPA